MRVFLAMLFLAFAWPASANERVSVSIPVPIENVGAKVDALIKAKGRKKKNGFRVSWHGPTVIRKQIGDTLYVSSRVRVSHKWLGRDTKTVDGTIRFFVDGNAIALRGELENIRNFPNWVEHVVDAWFNVEFGRIVRIIDRDRLAETPILSGVNAQIDAVQIAQVPDTQDVVVTVTASFVPPNVGDLATGIADKIRKAPTALIDWAE